MSDDLKEYYYLLKRKKRITNKELSEYIGCSESLISRFERSAANMSQDKIDKYCEYIEKKTKTYTITITV